MSAFGGAQSDDGTHPTASHHSSYREPMLAPGNVLQIGASQRVSSSEGQNASLLPALKLKAFTFTSQSEAV